MGGTGGDDGTSITLDASGNVYTTGQFQNTVDFDPGPGTFNLTANGVGTDCYISKLDASGNLVWVRQINGPSSEISKEIVVDASGNVYITGVLWGSADFDPGSGTYTLTSTGTGYDIFVWKLDASGNFVWAKLMGGATYDESYSIAVDATGNVYTTGYFTGTADFDPGLATYNLNSWGMRDIFISKLDVSGNFVWAKGLGGSDYDGGDGIAVDGSGNVLITGGFQVGVDFDPGPGSYVLNALGSADAFVCKFDASGSFLWAKQMRGPTSNDGSGAYSICTDNSGNVYTSGYFKGTVDFDPGAGTVNLTSVGFDDLYVSKLDASGNYVWAKAMGGGAYEEGYDIAVDGSGNVYTTGSFGGTCDFDPGAAAYNLIPAGGGLDEIFISKLDASGNFAWAKRMGGTGHDQGFSIAVDNAESVHVIGDFSGTADFDPDSSTVNMVSAGLYDIFVVKLNNCTSVYTTENITACSSYTWRNNITYTTPQSGVVYIAGEAVTGGCDSVYILNLVFNPPSFSLLSQTNISCNGGSNGTASVNPATGGAGNYTYDWTPGTPAGDGTTAVTGLSAGIWICTVTDGNNCTASQSFTITEPAAITNSFSYTACDSYTWNAQTYTTSGTYSQTLAAANGCDSLVTLNLTIDTSPNVTAIDNGSGTLVASSAASYQWINCSTGMAVSGATNATFSPTANGTYAVIGYSAGLCSDTSACLVINYLGVPEQGVGAWNIMPNPASSHVTIVFNVSSAELIIREVHGKPVAAKTIHPGEVISLEELSSGIYFFELITAEGKMTKRVVKM